MKLYGKDLPDVLNEMPWQLKIVVLAGVIWIPFSIIHAMYVYGTYGWSSSKPGPIKFTGTPPIYGALDPSIAPNGKGGTVLVFSTLDSDSSGTEGKREVAQIHMATAFTGCKAFSESGMIFMVQPDEFIGANGYESIGRGDWWYETPSIVYDPADPAGNVFKVYAYRHAWLGPDKVALAEGHGVIVLKQGPTIESLYDQQNTLESWLFTTSATRPPPPLDSYKYSYRLNDMDPSLKDMGFYSRPSVAILKGVYYMTLSAYLPGHTTADRTILLTSADHGVHWTFVGTILSQAQVVKMGPYTSLSGATLLEKKDHLYLAAVFGDAKSNAIGTFIIHIVDPAKGAIAADKNGLPKISLKIPHSSTKPSVQGGGFAAYSELCPHGIFASEFSGVTKNFQIFQTMKEPDE